MNRDIGATDPKPETKAHPYIVSYRNVCRLGVMPFPWKPNEKIMSVSRIKDIVDSLYYTVALLKKKAPLEYCYMMLNLSGCLLRTLRINRLHIRRNCDFEISLKFYNVKERFSGTNISAKHNWRWKLSNFQFNFQRDSKSIIFTEWLASVLLLIRTQEYS
jgi:hypothetical protein